MCIKKSAVALLLSVTPTASMADVPPPKPLFITKGMMCNDEMELQTLLSDIALAAPEMPETVPTGCGMFVPRAPIPMVATPLYWYETPMARVLVARLETIDGLWTQFAWIGYEPNPAFKPASLDPAL